MAPKRLVEWKPLLLLRQQSRQQAWLDPLDRLAYQLMVQEK
jgi:hypothetical protein